MMRTPEQINKLTRRYFAGCSKKSAMLAAGYTEKSPFTNVNKIFPLGSWKHELFAHGLFLFNWNQTKAAIYAGYSEKWAGTNTSRLMRHPRVKAAITRIRGELNSDSLFQPQSRPEST